MRNEIDPVLKAFLGDCLDDEPITDSIEHVENPVQTFFERAQYGDLDLTKSASDWEEQLPAIQKTIPDGGPLEKAYVAGMRPGRRASLEMFVQKSVAAGETVAGLAAFARRHDEETAAAIEAIGEALGVA